MTTVTARTPVDSNAAIANLKPGNVLRFPGKSSANLYVVTTVETYDGGPVKAAAWMQCQEHPDRKGRIRANLTAKGGFRLQVEAWKHGDLACTIAGFEIVA